MMRADAMTLEEWRGWFSTTMRGDPGTDHQVARLAVAVIGADGGRLERIGWWADRSEEWPRPLSTVAVWIFQWLDAEYQVWLSAEASRRFGTTP